METVRPRIVIAIPTILVFPEFRDFPKKFRN